MLMRTCARRALASPRAPPAPSPRRPRTPAPRALPAPRRAPRTPPRDPPVSGRRRRRTRPVSGAAAAFEPDLPPLPPARLHPASTHRPPRRPFSLSHRGPCPRAPRRVPRGSPGPARAMDRAQVAVATSGAARIRPGPRRGRGTAKWFWAPKTSKVAEDLEELLEEIWGRLLRAVRDGSPREVAHRVRHVRAACRVGDYSAPRTLRRLCRARASEFGASRRTGGGRRAREPRGWRRIGR